MRPTVSMRKALADPRLLGTAFPGDSWRPWRTLLIAAMGEKLTDDERALFKTLTGREHEPLQRVDPSQLSSVGAAASPAPCRYWRPTSPACAITAMPSSPVRGVCCSCVALDQKVAGIILDYAAALFEGSPILQTADRQPQPATRSNSRMASPWR